jgi:hypothetical protein
LPRAIGRGIRRLVEQMGASESAEGQAHESVSLRHVQLPPQLCGHLFDADGAVTLTPHQGGCGIESVYSPASPVIKTQFLSNCLDIDGR